ncbi:MAG: LysR family transcriptional regulator [Methylocystis sp.]|nr:LysR family transcriptional regulator [Methylocystis sp.]MCA3588849.1 LysR family transcriptional regulator [Methylocystis sp.]MCA3590854.1 LysR family transcriptional regulator [Methylocystis sp.]
MDIKQLRYFVSIARHGSFSRASEHLRIAQPALSSQIAALEAQLKTQLLVRHSRGIVLTESGRILLPLANDIIERVEEAAHAVQAVGKAATFAVRFGLPTTMTGVVTMTLIDAFARRHPDIVLHIVEGMTGHLQKWLDQNDIDGAILYGKSASFRGRVSSIGRERLVVIGREAGPFGDRVAVSFAELANLPLVHTTRDHQLRRMIENYSADAQVPLSFTAEIDSLAQIRERLLSVSGYTILPESMSLDWQRHGLKSWAIVKPELKVEHHLMCSSRFARHVKAGLVLDLVTDVTRGLISSGRWPGAALGSDDSAGALILAESDPR